MSSTRTGTGTVDGGRAAARGRARKQPSGRPWWTGRVRHRSAARASLSVPTGGASSGEPSTVPATRSPAAAPATDRTAAELPAGTPWSGAPLAGLHVTVYGDFNCPFSYLASLRADRLAAAGATVDWRAVEHDRRIPVAGGRLDGDSGSAADAEYAQVRSLLTDGEWFELNPPKTRPNTAAAVAAFAETSTDGRADAFRRRLFHAYWVDGEDIGSPDLIRRLLATAVRPGDPLDLVVRQEGALVTLARAPLTNAAWRRMTAWRSGWDAFAGGTVPALEVEGRACRGVDALRELARLAADLPPSGPGTAHGSQHAAAALPLVPDRSVAAGALLLAVGAGAPPLHGTVAAIR